jgi:hypothetical protein
LAEERKMKRNCPSPTTLLAAAEARLAAPEADAVLAHAAGCEECRTALAGLRTLQTALAELGAAEHAAQGGVRWAAVAARVERPRLSDRLPLGVWAAWRDAGVLLRPAVAGSLVAVLAGLALGTWMGIVTQRGTSQALATEPYAVSSLVSDGERGLAATYFGDATSESNALDGTSAADEGSATSRSGGTSAARDSEGARP